MSAWGKTDSVYDKPKFSKERQVRSEGQLITSATVSGGATSIVFTSNAETLIHVGDYVAGVNISGGILPGFFASNTTVSTVVGNTVTISTGTTGPIPSGTSIDFDHAIDYNDVYAQTYNQDTVLVSHSRMANTVGFANTETPHTGWVLTQTGTGGRAGRVTTEVLAVISEPVVTDPNSGHTSNAGTYFSGL